MSKRERLVLNLIPFAIFILGLVVARLTEPIFAPVLSGFTLNTVVRDGNKVTFDGSMTKVRDCKFVSVDATSIFEGGERDDSISLPIKFHDGNSDKSSRPTGRQYWGPWTIEIPVKPEVVAIALNVEHRCHFLWTQTTHLAVVPLIYKHK
jgi:hypothetical protein